MVPFNTLPPFFTQIELGVINFKKKLKLFLIEDLV